MGKPLRRRRYQAIGTIRSFKSENRLAAEKDGASFTARVALAAVFWTLLCTAYACGSLSYFDDGIIAYFSIIDLQSIALADIATPLFLVVSVTPSVGLLYFAQTIGRARSSQVRGYSAPVLITGALFLILPMVVFSVAQFLGAIPLDAMIGGLGDFFMFAWLAITMGAFGTFSPTLIRQPSWIGPTLLAIGALLLSFLAGDLSSSLRVRESAPPMLEVNDQELPVLLLTPSGGIVRVDEFDIAIAKHGTDELLLFPNVLTKFKQAQRLEKDGVE